ncbi:cellulose binding domain-containing protein [Massilia rubra]|uniref:Exo-alpha-sialidase n=1 Tax=Massilia rubra TaxID=2607910 RepID=A0ABX0LUT9_9BURK|nr:cellulose binding domain-containing protein [Massilia rubra]NHZ36625.1 exo-alpha-sialidase [Massilia rubra]
MTFMHRLSTIAAACALCAAASAPASAASETYQWNSVAMGGGGFVSAVIPSKTQKGLAYARTDVGGAYRWDNTAARWVPLLDWASEDETGLLGVESITLDPKNPAKLYMLAGISYFNNGKTMILRSSDYGKTFIKTDVSALFKAHGNGMGRQTGERLQVDPGSSNILYVGTRANGLFKSTDSGATWARLSSLNVTTTPNENGINFVALDPSSVVNGAAQRIVVGVSRFGYVAPNLYRSNDGGQTFAPVAGAPTDLMPQRAARASDGNLYVTYANGAGPHGHWAQPEPMDRGQIWKYNVGTGAWTNVTPAGVGSAFSGISVAPDNPNNLVASTVNTYQQQGNAWGDRIYTSTNGGASWTDVIARGFAKDSAGVSWVGDKAIHWAGTVELDPFDTKAAWVSSGNGIFKTANINATPATWTFNVAGLEETVPLNLVSIPGGPLVSAIGDYDGFRHTDTSRYAPIHMPSIGTTTGLDFAARKTSVLARAGGNDAPGMYYSTDTGVTWKKSAVMNGKNGQVALSSDGAVLLHSPDNSATSYRSTDFGASWTSVSGLNASSARPVADAVNPRKFYAYDNGRVFVSTDGGVSFAPKASLQSGGSKVIRAVPNREGELWVPLNGAGLARSTDSGATFSSIGSVSYAGAVGFGAAAAGASFPTVYIWGTVGGVKGVHRSVDAGATWVRVNDDAHQYGGPANGQFVVGDMNRYGVVYMSTAGRGIAMGVPGGATTPPIDPPPPVEPPPTPTPTAQCVYQVRSQWPGGFNGAVQITNRGSAAMNGWSVSWTYSDGSKVASMWNAVLSGSNPYTASNVGWNAVIQPGQTVEFGFQGTSGSAGSQVPVLGGSACAKAKK